MKFTLFKTDVQGCRRLSTKALDEFFNRMASPRKPVACEVYPNVEMRTKASHLPVDRRVNGVVVLTFGNLAEEERRAAVKESAMTLPTTLAAFDGADGESVVALVRYNVGSHDFDLADMLAEAAYDDAAILYTHVTGADIRREEPSGRMHFTMSHDSRPLYNADAIPLERNTHGEETMRIIKLLNARYQFRFNTLLGYTEFRSKNSSRQEWEPVDDRMVNSMTIEARLSGLDAWDKDIKRYVQSDMIKVFNPVLDFLDRAAMAWDGHTDHIGRLARTVPCAVPQWERWFRKWLLYMVAQWLGVTRQYGNSAVPLLISEQGNNKSTFCRRLLPDCLMLGYNDNLLVSEKKATLQAMSQFLLINLDEFNQIPAKIQEGFLKNIIQLARVKIKRPYGKHVEDFQRLASFIATTNEHSVLADPTGNRRFIGIELTGAIDVSEPIDYEGLYGQAVTLVRRGEQFWFDDAEVREIIAHNQQFQIQSPAEQWFYECFDIATDESDGEWLTCAAIYNRLKRYAGSGFNGNLSYFGRVLNNTKGLRQRRSNIGKRYLVRMK